MERLLTRVSSAERTPAAGSAATAAAALAAALVTKVARRSREVWPEAGGAIAQAAAFDSRLWRWNPRHFAGGDHDAAGEIGVDELIGHIAGSSKAFR